MQKEHTMSDDSLVSATETTDLTSAQPDTSAVTQTDAGGTDAVGSTPVDTPASDDTAAPSQPNTSSTATPTDPLDKVGTFAHNKQPVTPPPTTVQPPTWDDISKKLGIKDPKDLDRIVGMQNLYGRQANEVGQLRQQLTQLQQEQQAAQQRAQEEAQRLNLSPFHSRHPQFAQNQQRIQAYQGYKRTLATHSQEAQADPNLRARIAQEWGVTQEDQRLAAQQEQYNAETDQRFRSDPQGFIHNEVSPLMDAKFQQFEQYLEAKIAARGLIQQHQPLIEQHADRMNWILDPNIPAREKAIWAAQQEAKVAELLATKVPEAQHVETLKARTQLASRQVAPTRAAAAVAPSPFAEYEKLKGKDPRAQEKLLDGLFGKVD